MPRVLPRYDRDFDSQVSFALSYTGTIERMRVQGIGRADGSLNLAEIEFSYELAFLRVFLAWKFLLENAFLRLICGYCHSSGQEPLLPGSSYYAKIADAEAAVLGGRSYRLWHNPDHVIRRAAAFLSNSRYEIVLASAQTRLEHYAAVRHRIAHSQKHAQSEFDRATMVLAGRRYRGSRPGRFLRDWVSGARPAARWISAMSDELKGLAQQICA